MKYTLFFLAQHTYISFQSRVMILVHVPFYIFIHFSFRSFVLFYALLRYIYLKPFQEVFPTVPQRYT